jgi:hypothetical protein
MSLPVILRVPERLLPGTGSGFTLGRCQQQPYDQRDYTIIMVLMHAHHGAVLGRYVSLSRGM